GADGGTLGAVARLVDRETAARQAIHLPRPRADEHAPAHQANGVGLEVLGDDHRQAQVTLGVILRFGTGDVLPGLGINPRQVALLYEQAAGDAFDVVFP